MSDNYIRDVLKDTLRHTFNLGMFEMVRVSGTTTSTEIDTFDPDRTVIVKGKLKNPVPDFADATVGLSRMEVLNGYLRYPGFEADDAEVVVEKDQDDSPVEVKFTAPNATSAVYRFTGESIVNQQISSYRFRGATWELDYNPTQKNIKDLAFFVGVLGTYESTFVPVTENGALIFKIGSGTNDRTNITICDNVSGTFTQNWSWPLETVLKILRLGDKSNCSMSFNKDGLLKIEIDSGFSEYTYLLPAKG